MRVVVVGGGLFAANGPARTGPDVEALKAGDAIEDVRQGNRINLNETVRGRFWRSGTAGSATPPPMKSSAGPGARPATPENPFLTKEGDESVRPGIRGVLPYLLDILVPLVAYYALTAAGLSSFWALVIGGGLTAAVSLTNTLRRGRLDNLGVLVIVEIVLGLILDLTVRDPRLTLARGSLFIALAGLWVLLNTFGRRPLTVDITKAFAFRKGGAEGVAAFEWLAANSPRFLRIQRSLSAVWSLMFLAYAILRVIVIYTVSVSQAVGLNEIPGIVAVAVCLVVSARAGARLEKMVNDRMADAGMSGESVVSGQEG